MAEDRIVTALLTLPILLALTVWVILNDTDGNN